MVSVGTAFIGNQRHALSEVVVLNALTGRKKTYVDQEKLGDFYVFAASDNGCYENMGFETPNIFCELST